MSNRFLDLRDEIESKYGTLGPHALAQGYLGKSFRDQLILAFIRANPGETQDTEFMRLNAARAALFGEVTKVRRNATDDEYILHLMARWHDMDIEQKSSDPTYPCRSIRALAAQAAGLVYDDAQLEPVVERVRKKFMDRKESLLSALDAMPTEITVLQLFALEEIEQILSTFGVDFFAEE